MQLHKFENNAVQNISSSTFVFAGHADKVIHECARILKPEENCYFTLYSPRIYFIVSPFFNRYNDNY
jgi:ubiquinone/menaquinone biosynthesis C-methylase UbiE